jgi:hypothetical protein
MISIAPSARSFALSMFALAVFAGCTSDGGHRKTSATPTAPSAVAADGAANTAAGAALDRSVSGGSLKASRFVSQAVEFPPRDGTFQFRQQLETAYRDQLRRSATTSFVDIEGSIVWTQEYLRYRVNGCGHQDAVTRVTAQIQGRGIQPICQDFTGTTVTFPPRNEPFAFRQELERLYRDDLRRGAVQTFVDAEGDIVWTQEYLRYRLNGCSHPDATDRVLTQITGGPVQPTCTGTTPPPPPTGGGSIGSFVTGVSAPGGTTTLVNSPRPNAGAGPIVTPSNTSGGLVTLTASSPIDHVVVSVNTTGSGATRFGPEVVVGSYYDVRLSSPQTTVQLTIQGAGSFNLEFAASLGAGPLGPYQPQPFSAGLNLTGTWLVTFMSSFGQSRGMYQLTQNGNRVTGVGTSPEAPGQTFPFDGTLNGTTLTFGTRTSIGVPECGDLVESGTAQVTSANTITGTVRYTFSCSGFSFDESSTFTMTRQ